MKRVRRIVRNDRQALDLQKWLVLSLLLGCSVIAGCASLGMKFDKGGEKDQQITDDLGQTIDYDVKLSGVDPQEKRLLEALHETSTAIRLRNRPPPTLAGLDRRAEDDIARFITVLRSFGFYDGRVTVEVHTKPGEGDGKENDGATAPAAPPSEKIPDAPPHPVVLEYRIETGPAYHLAAADLIVVRSDKTVYRPMDGEELQKAGLSLGMRAEADPVIQAELKAVDIVRGDGYPLAKAGERKVIANTAAKTLSVTYEIITGKKANFGEVTVTGAKQVDPEFIAGYHSWQEGAQFSPDEIVTTRHDLAESNLFESVNVRPADSVNEQGEIPIEIEVTERAHRSIGGGLDYSTADGIGANALWEHRNLFGAGEKLRVRLEGSQLQQGLETGFNKPQFLQRRQAFVVDVQGNNYNTDAYEGEVAESFAGIERRFAEFWSATGGVTVEYSSLTGADSPNEDFYLGGLRGILRRDSTNNALDPTTGNRLELAVSPYTSLGGANSQFISVLLGGSHYHPFDQARRYLLAGRGRIGGIWGEERSALPSNKRFYSGGGGSVRGYEYQKVGPLDDSNNAIGGRSLIEAGMEFRARVTNSIGVVPFVEGGNVFENSRPDDLNMRWAAGLGLRYYTAIGPLRFDIAMPLDKRAGIDDDFQIYLSIGQAF